MGARNTRRQKDKSGQKAAAGPHPYGRVKFEWPLLIYPALFLTTLVVLFLVSKSIENQPTSFTEGPALQSAPGATGSVGNSETTPAFDRNDMQQPGSASFPASHEPQEIPLGPAEPTGPPSNDRSDWTDRSALTADTAGGTRPTEPLEGPDLILAILSRAVRQNDHARIKECLDQLVAMGDAAVVPLNDVINAEEAASLWAAEALARIGTPLATTALLDTLSQTKEGLYKEELGKRIAGIRNHESWPVLLDTALQTGDPTVLRAADSALSMLADTPVVDGIIARYEAAATEAEIERLTRLLGNIRSSQATDALLALAGPVQSTPQDDLAKAAVEALGKIGNTQAVSHLMQRLEAMPPGQGAGLYNAITQIDSPAARSALLYAAGGNKEVSAESGRAAAIEALKNFPDGETLALLERILIEEDNGRVRTAATRTLDTIRQAPHVVTAKVDPLVKPNSLSGLPRQK